MPITRYTKWTGSLLDTLNLEDLLDELSQYFLQSGFPDSPWGDPNSDIQQTLREAIADKLVELGHITSQVRDNWLDNPESEEARQLDEVINQIIQRMVDEGWLRSDNPNTEPNQGGEGIEDAQTKRERFELTS